MLASRVVEAIDVFEEGDLDLSAGLPVVPPDQLGLQRLEEAFDCGIVIVISLATHRHPEPVVAQQLLIVVAVSIFVGAARSRWGGPARPRALVR